MNLKKLIFYACLTLMVFSSNAFANAGGSDRGGADTKSCGALSVLVNLEKTAILADIVPDQYTGQDPHRFDQLQLDEIKKGLIDYIDRHVSEASKIHAALDVLHFLPPSDEPLKELDTGFNYPLWKKIFTGCKKQQLATQDWVTGNVQIFRPNYERLSKIEQALLEIHEAYIRISYDSGERDLAVMESYARDQIAAIYLNIDVPRDSYFYKCLTFQVDLSFNFGGADYNFGTGAVCGNTSSEDFYHISFNGMVLDEANADTDAAYHNAIRLNRFRQISSDQMHNCITSIAKKGFSPTQIAHASMAASFAKNPDPSIQARARDEMIGLCYGFSKAD